MNITIPSQTLFQGAIQLLDTCVTVTKEAAIDCTVMGGWNALLYKLPHRVHPNTFDVDLLLPPRLSKMQAEKLIRSFLASGFAQSSKHAFQLIGTTTVNDTSFAFNVDLLHPYLEALYPEMFVDLMSHEVPLSDFDRKTMSFAKSIVLPGLMRSYGNGEAREH